MEGDLGWCCSGGSNNWDLHAVVRSACSGGPPPASNDDSFSWLLQTPSASEDQLWDAVGSQPPLADPAVDDLCLQAFFASTKLETPQPSSPRNEAPPQQYKADGPPGKLQTSSRAGGAGPSRSKRKSKKSQVKKEVTRVPVGGPPADLWAWRKYGQKPIKGSPYPRGYYRCSTDKDCKARKQVERCRADPATLIVTYTGGDHSHPVPLQRNSLSGTTRNKAQAQPVSPYPGKEAPKSEAAPSASGTDTKSQGSPSMSAGLSPRTPRRSPSLQGVQYKDEEDDDAAPSSRLLLLEGTEMEGRDAEEDDVLVYLMPEEETAPAGPGKGSGCEDVMLFPKPDEPPPTTWSSRTDGGGGEAAAQVMNIGEETFSISGPSAWEAASETRRRAAGG